MLARGQDRGAVAGGRATGTPPPRARRRNDRGARGRRGLVAVDAAAGMVVRVQSQRDGRRNAAVSDAAGLVRPRLRLRPRDGCGAASSDVVAGQQPGGRCRRGHERATGPLRWARTWRHRRAWTRPSTKLWDGRSSLQRAVIEVGGVRIGHRCRRGRGSSELPWGRVGQALSRWLVICAGGGEDADKVTGWQRG